MKELGAAEADAEDLVLACSEAAANVVEHTRPNGPNALVIRGRVVLDSVVRLTVRDYGHWRFTRKAPERGRGLDLIRRLADHVSILRHADGTEVTLYRRLQLSRPPPSTSGAHESGRRERTRAGAGGALRSR